MFVIAIFKMFFAWLVLRQEEIIDRPMFDCDPETLDNLGHEMPTTSMRVITWSEFVTEISRLWTLYRQGWPRFDVRVKQGLVLLDDMWVNLDLCRPVYQVETRKPIRNISIVEPSSDPVQVVIDLLEQSEFYDVDLADHHPYGFAGSEPVDYSDPCVWWQWATDLEGVFQEICETADSPVYFGSQDGGDASLGFWDSYDSYEDITIMQKGDRFIAKTRGDQDIIADEETEQGMQTEVKEWCDKEQYWPNLWFASDHEINPYTIVG